MINNLFDRGLSYFFVILHHCILSSRQPTWFKTLMHHLFITNLSLIKCNSKSQENHKNISNNNIYI